MNAIKLDGVRYRFPNAPQDALAGVNWQAAPGTLSLVAGPSGSGKTTLLRVLNGLVPHLHGGRFGGMATIFGLDTRSCSPGELAELVGTVFQDPEAQCVTDTVEDELVFGMEQRGLPRPEMRRRVAALTDQLGIGHVLHRTLDTLSGGERQRVILAAVLLLRPRLLVLDEPTSQLDPRGAAAFLEALTGLDGTTAVIAEHRLERLLPVAQQLACMREGRLTAGPTRRMLNQLDDLPPLLELGRRLGWEPLPLTVAEARRFLTAHPPRPPSVLRRPPATGDPLLKVSNLSLSLSEDFKLNDLSFTLHEGELVALIGPNGSGKTSLLKALLGIQTPERGAVQLQGQDLDGVAVAQRARRIGYVPQHATSILHQESLAAELALTLRVQGKQGDIEGTLADLGIAAYRNQHPLDLSGGERQRAALAALVVAEPLVLLLDEPTRGLPASDKERLGSYLRRFVERGRSALVVTHDAEFVARHADRVLELHAGRLIADGPPAAVLPASADYGTSLNRLLGGGVLTIDEYYPETGAKSRKSAEFALTPNQGA